MTNWGYYLIQGRSGNLYRVRLSCQPNDWADRFELSGHCTCKGYRYNSNRHHDYACRHIRQAITLMRQGLRGGSAAYPWPTTGVQPYGTIGRC